MDELKELITDGDTGKIYLEPIVTVGGDVHEEWEYVITALQNGYKISNYRIIMPLKFLINYLLELHPEWKKDRFIFEEVTTKYEFTENSMEWIGQDFERFKFFKNIKPRYIAWSNFLENARIDTIKYVFDNMVDIKQYKILCCCTVFNLICTRIPPSKGDIIIDFVKNRGFSFDQNCSSCGPNWYYILKDQNLNVIRFMVDQGYRFFQKYGVIMDIYLVKGRSSVIKEYVVDHILQNIENSSGGLQEYQEGLKKHGMSMILKWSLPSHLKDRLKPWAKEVCVEDLGIDFYLSYRDNLLDIIQKTKDFNTWENSRGWSVFNRMALRNGNGKNYNDVLAYIIENRLVDFEHECKSDGWTSLTQFAQNFASGRLVRLLIDQKVKLFRYNDDKQIMDVKMILERQNIETVEYLINSILERIKDEPDLLANLKSHTSLFIGSDKVSKNYKERILKAVS